MMNFSFFFVVSLFLIVCQTIVLPGTALFACCFDILFVVVVYMSIIFSHYGIVAAIALIGCIMDSLSGSPFFLHTFSYVWVYIIVQMVRQFVFYRSPFFVVGVSVAAVVIEQTLVVFCVFLVQGSDGISGVDYSLLLRQVVMGGILIPSGVWLLSVLRQNWIFMIRQFKRSMYRRYRE